jgi:hypothetical protein
MTGRLERARFPSVPAGDGQYESFYLKLADPERPRGAWIRYTVLKRADREPLGSLWCTLWPGDGALVARKETLAPDEVGTGAGALIRVGQSRLQPGRAGGALGGCGWQLSYAARAPAFPYLPRPWMYRTPLPRTKAVSLAPHAVFDGHVTVGEHTLIVESWPGMVGHNWGAEHAERWVWLHGAGFPEAPEAWLDAVIGRVKVGGLTLPWLANGGLWLEGRIYRLGGPAAIRATAVAEEPTRCRFTLAGRGVTVAGEVAGSHSLTAAWRYSDPTGSGHITCNCSVASLRIGVRVDGAGERMLELPAGAAYEFGAREPPAGIPIQPFPDP